MGPPAVAEAPQPQVASISFASSSPSGIVAPAARSRGDAQLTLIAPPKQTEEEVGRHPKVRVPFWHQGAWILNLIPLHSSNLCDILLARPNLEANFEAKLEAKKDTPPENRNFSCARVSLKMVTGVSAKCSPQIVGRLKGKDVHVFIDGGASHSSIHGTLLKEMSIGVVLTHSHKIMSVCKGLDLTIHAKPSHLTSIHVKRLELR